jgi:uracil-DNA glycosylase
MIIGLSDIGYWSFTHQTVATPTVSAADFLPDKFTLAALQSAAKQCRGCPLYANATQTVFGEGPTRARLMFVGEQPGDSEDIAGQPFVGPAGKLLGNMLEEVGIDREKVYVTNAVKHFKWQPRGKRRLHAKPSAREVHACRPWLEAEVQVVKPAMVVCLGATAAQSMLGRTFKLTERRGEPFPTDWAEWTMATYHPSAVLRAKQTDQANRLYDDFLADLNVVAKAFKRLG